MGVSARGRGRFAFIGASKTVIQSISQFGKIVPQFLSRAGVFLRTPPPQICQTEQIPETAAAFFRKRRDT